MHGLVFALICAGASLLGGLVMLVGRSVRGGAVDFSQLLEGDTLDQASETGFSSYPSLGRSQVLGVTLVSLVTYLGRLMADRSHFPALPAYSVWLLTGSNGIYLVGKAQAMGLVPLRPFKGEGP